MTDWMLIYSGPGEILLQRMPEDLKSPLNELFALFRVFRDEYYGCFLHRGHGGRCEPGGQSAQGSASSQFV
jgi:hypothetical protein